MLLSAVDDDVVCDAARGVARNLDALCASALGHPPRGRFGPRLEEGVDRCRGRWIDTECIGAQSAGDALFDDGEGRESGAEPSREGHAVVLCRDGDIGAVSCNQNRFDHAGSPYELPAPPFLLPGGTGRD